MPIQCDNCGEEIPEADVLREAARVGGQRSKRKLTSKQARSMQRRSVEARKRKAATGCK